MRSFLTATAICLVVSGAMIYLTPMHANSDIERFDCRSYDGNGRLRWAAPSHAYAGGIFCWSDDPQAVRF